MDPTEFQSVLDSYKPQQQTATAQPTMQPQQSVLQQAHHGSGNWLTHLLPTAGSLGGAAGGAALGASLGSIVPIIGTGIGGFAGGILGAAFGGGGAKAAENAVEGKGISEGVGASALEGGLGQAAGGVAGKVLGKGAQLLAGRAGKITSAAKATAENAAMDKAAADTAAAIKNNYGGIKPSVQSSNNLAGNQKMLQDWGLDHTDPQAMASASKGGLFINDIDEAALGAGKPIKTTDLISSKDITTAAPAEQQALVKAGIITPEGSLPTHVSPVQANKFAQDLNTQVRDLQATMANAKANGRVADYTAAKEEYSNLNKLYKNVQNMSASPGVNESITARTISAEEKQQLVEQFGEKQAAHIEDAINNAKTHQDLVNAKLPFAQMNELSGQALQDLKATATPRAVAREKMDINGDGTADVAPPSTNMPGLASDIHNANGTVGKALALGKHAVNNPGILNTLSRMGSLLSKAAPATGVVTGTSNNIIQSGDTMDQNQQQDMAPVSMQQPQQGLSREDLLTLALYSPGALAAIAPSAQQTQNTVNAQAAETALNGLGNAPTGGILSSIQGKLGLGGTGEYQRKAATAAQQIAAAIPGTDPATIEKQLTNYMAGGGSIDDAVNGLLQQLHSVVQANQTTGLGGILGVNAGDPQTVTSQLPAAAV